MHSAIRTLFAPLLFLAVWGVVFVTLANTLAPEGFAWAFSESGPFEIASEFLWVGLGVLIVTIWRRLTLPVAAAALLCLAAAAREAEFHKVFTGYSVLKFGYYTDLSRDVGPKLVAGLIVGLAFASAVVLLVRVRELTRGLNRWHSESWVLVIALAVTTLVVTKVLDRAPAILARTFELPIPGTIMPTVSALEEGVEMLLPVLFGWAAVLYALAHPRAASSGCRRQVGGASPGQIPEGLRGGS